MVPWKLNFPPAEFSYQLNKKLHKIYELYVLKQMAFYTQFEIIYILAVHHVKLSIIKQKYSQIIKKIVKLYPSCSIVHIICTVYTANILYYSILTSSLQV